MSSIHLTALIGVIISLLAVFLLLLFPGTEGKFVVLGAGGELVLFFAGVIVASFPFARRGYLRIMESYTFYLTSSHKQNWKRAEDLCRNLRNNDSAYDTTSYENETGFEKAVENAVVNNSVKYYRMFCFSTSGSEVEPRPKESRSAFQGDDVTAKSEIEQVQQLGCQWSEEWETQNLSSAICPSF